MGPGSNLLAGRTVPTMAKPAGLPWGQPCSVCLLHWLLVSRDELSAGATEQPEIKGWGWGEGGRACHVLPTPAGLGYPVSLYAGDIPLTQPPGEFSSSLQHCT